MIKNLIKIIFILSIVSGCEYQTDDVFYRNVDKNVSQPNLTINLNLLSDTTYFYTTPNVVMTLNITNKEIYGVKFFVNNIEVENVLKDGSKYSITLSSTGTIQKKVRAVIYTSSGTGSIADKVKAESFVIQTKEWILIYVPEKPVLKTEIVDGRLKLSWTPIKSSVKLKYYIYSSSHINYLVDSTYNNWYVDSSYFGRNIDYMIKYGKKDITGYTVNGDASYRLPNVYFSNKDSFFIKWDKPKLYNAFNGLRLRIDNDTVNLNSYDTAYVYKRGIFGKNYLVTLDLLLKNNNYNRYSNYISIGGFFAYYPSSFLPDYTFFTHEYFPLTGTSFYYGNKIDNQTYLFKYSLDSRSVMANKKLWTNYFSVSPNNRYILYEDDTHNLKLLETYGLGVVNSIPVSQVVSYPGISSIVVSDNGVSVFYEQSNRTMIVYDIIGNKKIAEAPVSKLISKYKISGGGKYIFVPEITTLFKVENNSCSTVWKNESVSNQFKYFDFFPDNQEKVCLYDGATFYIKNSVDFSTINSFSIIDKNIVNVDFPNQKILTVANSVYYIYSLNSGSLLRTIPTSIYYSDRVRLFNDYIIFDYCQLNLKNQ